jgi:hypothetical protein
MTVSGRVPEGLVRFYCNRCHDAPVDTLPLAEVWCPKGHKCSQKPTEKTLENLEKSSS